MPKSHHLRGIKVCPHCGAGYDGFRARDARGRYCSPACLDAARALHRSTLPLVDAGGDGPVIAPA
ncbi:MAG: hypothetical protein ACYDAC_08985 [Candidatus Dormibacteria bacterium]